MTKHHSSQTIACDGDFAAVQQGPDPVVQRILREENGDQQAVIKRLQAKHWEEAEARTELAKCLAQGVRRGKDQTRRAGAGHG